jgi:hypothetical protein
MGQRGCAPAAEWSVVSARWPVKVGCCGWIGLPKSGVRRPGLSTGTGAVALGRKRIKKDCLDRRRIAFGEYALVPVRIGQGNGARIVQLLHLVRREIPADGAEILSELLFVARPDDHR